MPLRSHHLIDGFYGTFETRRGVLPCSGPSRFDAMGCDGAAGKIVAGELAMAGHDVKNWNDARRWADAG